MARSQARFSLARSLRRRRRQFWPPQKGDPLMYALSSRIKRIKAQHPRLVALALGSAFLGLSVSAWALVTADADIQVVKKVEGTVIGSIGGHVTQATLTNLVKAGKGADAFEQAFDHGNDLFDHSFNTADGIGANVGVGERFTRMPRADLTGPTEWANHPPARATGPNATVCTSCHNQGGDDGSGDSGGNVHRDAEHTKTLNQMITRNAPHVFGLGGLQRLAEE